MTPKEKAKGLVDNFELNALAGNISNNEDWELVSKQCALICVHQEL